MPEYYVELQDASGTCYGATDQWTGEHIYFEALDEARMYAKSRVNSRFIVTLVIETGRSQVVDFFQR